MIEVIFLLVLGGVFILLATVQDLKTREVDNWLNFSLIVFALGVRFFFSLFENDWNFLYQGLIGFGIFLVIGNLFYYSRVFAGGDAKLMIALGPVLPLSYSFLDNLKLFSLFIGLFLVVGVFYGLVWSLFLGFLNFNKVKKNFGKIFNQNRVAVFSCMFVGILVMVLGFLESVMFYFGVLIFISSYLLVYAKTIENVGLIKEVSVEVLREGDWLAESLKLGKRHLNYSWDGLSKKDIVEIKKYHKKVKVKNGIPFVPVFLISFLIWIFLWFVTPSV